PATPTGRPHRSPALRRQGLCRASQRCRPLCRCRRPSYRPPSRQCRCGSPDRIRSCLSSSRSTTPLLLPGGQALLSCLKVHLAKGTAMTGASSHRPTIAVTQHAISAGHYLAATAGFDILQAGGNAIDAGCAAGIALGVLQSDLVDVAGVAPIMIYLADKQEVVTIAGLGYWPKALDPELFMREHGGKIPVGVLRTVIPAAPDA